jgi:hypothetical protein
VVAREEAVERLARVVEDLAGAGDELRVAGLGDLHAGHAELAAGAAELVEALGHALAGGARARRRPPGGRVYRRLRVFEPLPEVVVDVLLGFVPAVDVDVVVVPPETEPGATEAIHVRSVVSAMRP